MYATLILLLGFLCSIQGKCVVKTFLNTKVNICRNNPPLVEDRNCTKVAVTDCEPFPEEESEILIIEVLQDIKELGEATFINLRNLQRVTISSKGLEFMHPDCFMGLGYVDFFNGCNNELQQIQQGVFTGTTFSTIFLNSNQIVEIEAGAFSRMGRLEFLDLQNNSLPGLQKLWFKDSPRLATLIFNYNSITEIETGTFRDLARLRTLLMNFNNIERLQYNIFRGLQFNDLQLIGNNLTKIDEHNFGGRTFVGHLGIGMNRITNLSKVFRKSIQNMARLTLFPNPILCSCLSEIEDWAKLEKIKIGKVKSSHYFYLGDFPYCIGAEKGDPKICNDKDEESFSAAMDRFKAVVLYTPVRYRMYTFC